MGAGHTNPSVCRRWFNVSMIEEAKFILPKAFKGMHYRDDPKEVAQNMQSPSQMDTLKGKINKSKGKSLTDI